MGNPEEKLRKKYAKLFGSQFMNFGQMQSFPQMQVRSPMGMPTLSPFSFANKQVMNIDGRNVMVPGPPTTNQMFAPNMHSPMPQTMKIPGIPIVTLPAETLIVPPLTIKEEPKL